MQEIICNGNQKILTLTTDEILELHDILCNNYTLLPEMEPISPPGVKNLNLLESAVSRQLVGSGDYYKYSNIYSNCATLVFGIVKNHSFHNGNKRIGFLALIKHLYSNSYVISPNVKHLEIYELLRTLANSSLSEHASIFQKHFYSYHKKDKWNDELQIKYLASWIKANCEHKNTKVKKVTTALNDLERLLRMKNLDTRFDGKFLHISTRVYLLQELFGKRTIKKSYLIRGSQVHSGIVDQIRKDFGITFLDGVDNSSFYNEDILSQEIVSYKKIIYKLAKT